jgi:hypothetical protein
MQKECAPGSFLFVCLFLVQLSVPGSGWGGQFLNDLPRWMFVSLHNLFYDIIWSEYVVNKMQVGFCLSSEKHFLKNKVKLPSFQSPLQIGIKLAV